MSWTPETEEHNALSLEVYKKGLTRAPSSEASPAHLLGQGLLALLQPLREVVWEIRKVFEAIQRSL